MQFLFLIIFSSSYCYFYFLLTFFVYVCYLFCIQYDLALREKLKTHVERNFKPSHCKQGGKIGFRVINHTKQNPTWVYNFPRKVSTQPLFFYGIPYKRSGTNCVYTYILLREERFYEGFYKNIDSSFIIANMYTECIQ